jgi:HEAT repeat protein
MILTTGAAPAFAAHPPVTRNDAARAGAEAASADAVVGRLRELPLPMQASPRGLASTKAAPPPLPALESRRQRVYAELHALGQASVPALVRALRDPDPEMRRNVVVAMDVVGGGWWQFPDGDSKLDLRPALPALLMALRDSDQGVRAWAAQDISDIGAAAVTAVPSLRAMLRSPDPQSRGSACNALGGIGFAARGSLPDLQRALDDPSPEVRQAARDAIVSIDRATSAH